ncbi:MAG: ASCH domain-containing protein [Actinomycetota bacterium]
MDSHTPLGAPDPSQVSEFWQRFITHSAPHRDVPEPEAWAFGDSVELADELIALVLEGTKRATAGSVAEYEREGEPLPDVGDLEIVTDGACRPRGVLRISEVRIGPLSSVDDRFAYDEGEGDRTRAYWLSAHTEFFQRVLPDLGIDVDPDMATIFQRFEVLYQEP